MNHRLLRNFIGPSTSTSAATWISRVPIFFEDLGKVAFVNAAAGHDDAVADLVHEVRDQIEAFQSAGLLPGSQDGMNAGT
jgi:hypothetical protein